jgi:NAD(P)-dependent dehydrogenase (short-subunit alcohol dehydrogenase family)
MSGSRLAGKVAIVMGGATGIGRATARLFAAEGAHVVIADINESDGIATAHEVQGLFIGTDISNAEQVKAAVSRTVGEVGGLHVLVNSAANLGGYHSATAMPEKEWRDVLSASLDGVFYASKYAGIEMKSNGAGSIVTISSVEGLMGAAHHAAYVTAKSALFGLTRSMAIDLGSEGVRVKSIVATLRLRRRIRPS